MDAPSQDIIEALDELDTDQLYAVLSGYPLGVDDELDKAAPAEGRKTYATLLPSARSLLCSNTRFRSALTRKPASTIVEIAVIAADVLFHTEKFVGVPVGAVSLLIARESLEALCVE